MKIWIESHYYDFLEDNSLMENFKIFINEDLKRTNMELIYNDLSYTLNNFQKRKEIEIKEHEILKDEKGLLYMYFPKEYSIDKLIKITKTNNINNKNEIFSWNEAEIAQQLTIIDHKLFSLIQPKGNVINIK
jgi:hypothetical protein